MKCVDRFAFNSAVEALGPLDLYAIDFLSLGRGALAVEAETAHVATFSNGRRSAELEIVSISDRRIPGKVVVAAEHPR